MKKYLKGGVFLLCLFFAPALFGGEYDFDISEIEKKPYSFDGSVEFSSNIYSFDKDSAMYNLKYQEKPESYDYKTDFRLNGGYETGSLKYTVKTSTVYLRSPDEETETDFLFMEQYIGYFGDDVRFSLGKMTMKWGKGYAYNPAGFLDRPKNIDSPEDAQEGYQIASAEFTRSYSGALKNISYIQALYYVNDDMNRSLGRKDGANYAGKFYMLLFDTDIDLMFTGGESADGRYGVDFSRNIRTNLEIHGEYGRTENIRRMTLGGNETVCMDNWLLGLRYLTENDATYILEYFHKSTGYTEDEMDIFYEAAENSTNPSSLAKSPYAGNNPMTNYLYLKTSVREPFDVLYFTPAVVLTANLDDGSFSFSPEAVYTGFTNLELKLKAYVLSGGNSTEFGEKPMDKRAEIKIKYYF